MQAANKLITTMPLLAEQGLLAAFVGYAFGIVLILVIIMRTPKLLSWLFSSPKKQKRGRRQRR